MARRPALLPDPADVDLGGDGPSRRLDVPPFPDAGAGSAEAGAPAEPEGWADPALRARLWWAAGVVYRARWVIAALTVLATGAAVYLTLQIPNRYRAETRVLLPSGSGMGGLLDAVVPGASELLGKKGGDYVRYLAILTSRTTMQEIVDRYDLVDVYDVADARYPNDVALDLLGQNATFVVSPDYDYLAVQVLDEDPRRAAQMSTHLVEILNERQVEMSTSSASETRRFMEARLVEARATLDSVLTAQQAFQERYGVVRLDAQADALMSAMAVAQGAVAQAEAQYRALETLYGDENPQVASARAALESAREQAGSLTAGGEAIMPVPLRQLPTVNRQYADLMVQLRTSEAILMGLQPLYEQSVLQERQEVSAVQVLDPAVPPQRKAEPKRMILVAASMLAALFLLVVLSVAVAWARQRGGATLNRLRTAA